MKTKLSFFLCLLGLLAHSQNINIPDNNLKIILSLSNTTTYLYAKNLSGQWMKVDTNGDGEIQPNEAALVKEVYLRNFNSSTSGFFPVHSIVGLESFPNLDSLYCTYNSFNSPMDFSSLIHLKLLESSYCDISSINLSGLNSLETLICPYNNLNNLDVFGLTNLKVFVCDGNQISSLDISSNTLLTILGCDYNQITALNFSYNPLLNYVVCDNNQITSLDFSSNPQLTKLVCENNNLASLNVKNGINQYLDNVNYTDCWKTGNPNLTTICADASEVASVQSFLDGCGDATQVVTVTSNCGLANEGFMDNEVVLFPNPTKSNININNNIKTIELFDFQGRLLVSKTINEKQTTLDVSNYTNGVYFVKITTDADVKIGKVIKE